MNNRSRNYFLFKKIQIKIGQCPDFPFFGARYPDATCIDGTLWDLDNCDDEGLLSSGNNPPCPFCNTKEFLEYEVGDCGPTKFSVLKRILFTKLKYA